MRLGKGDLMVTVIWHANPFRGDKFEDVWTPAAELALDFGATWWALLRSQDDPLDFTQLAIFASERDWERYWFSEAMAEARVEASGLFQVPVLPSMFRVTDAGEVLEAAGA